MNRKYLTVIIPIILGMSAFGVFYYTIPVKRIATYSDLEMLGDLNNDRIWNQDDLQRLQKFLKHPFVYHDNVKFDVNKNGLIDNDDILILKHLYQYSDPYQAEINAANKKMPFPRPRELFRYIPKTEYRQNLPFVVLHDMINKSPLSFLQEVSTKVGKINYNTMLFSEIYSEGLRFTLAYLNRKEYLTKTEASYVQAKISRCEDLYRNSNYYDLLLNLISLVEDAETLSITNQNKFVSKILYFRDELKKLLMSDFYRNFNHKRTTYTDVFKKIETSLYDILNIKIDIEHLDSPRDFTKIQNYIDRSEWQYYKTSARKVDIKKIIQFAQNNTRYLRTVSKTSKKTHDVTLKNHNLPMILLFREALSIKAGDKKSACGMIDEAIRIPLAWVRSIPIKLLPSSIALENFLLPGNKEDGSDKSRHWNVFGCLSIYKSAKESLVLSIKRESADLRSENYSVTAMTEFIRDTIANINGIYYVLSINDSIIKKE